MSLPTDPSRGSKQTLLGREEVAVWCVEDGPQITDSLLARYERLLNDDERSRYERYRADRAKRQFLIGRALVRTTLSRYEPSVSPEQWWFEANEYGRPEIAPGLIATALRFNLSHTDGFAACAVAWENDIGVDVEFVARRTGGVHLARRFFSASEVDDLLRLPAEQQRDAFFDYWTLKEAYIKARGMGLAIPLGHFSFHLR
ncbi:MAG TPA: 4'-phosphopantetheinyl transferase superfamily protein, partial [Pirellulales bacterium]|nr:4'-phosphopantetheinyl transferase superfamily protein [Pirellulales bacterium]